MKNQKKNPKFNNKKVIPVNSPVITLADAKNVFYTAKTGWVSSAGQQIEDFEDSFSKFIGLKNATSVSSGTAALEIVIKALGIKKGDEVIIPNFTIISNALCVIKQGATPVFVDCNRFDWNMKIEDIEKKITKKTKAIIATHIYNYPLDIEKIKKISKSYKITLIEDAAEVLGHKFKKKYCGSFGDVSIFSFYANKHITTGEGGMIVTDNKKIAERCFSLRNIFFNNFKRFVHYGLGWNARLTNIQASIGIAQLERLDEFVKIKKKIGDTYNKGLVNNENYIKPLESTSYGKNIYWVYGVLIAKPKLSVNKIVKKLKKVGIETRPFFWPLHKQPILKKIGLFKNIKLPVSEYLSKNGFYLPSGLSLNKKQQAYVIKNFNKIIS